MAGDMVIADVGESLIELLRSRMSDLVTADSVILFSPGEIESGDLPRLSLFFYQMMENTYLKNQEMDPVGTTALRFPPFTLDLYYMLTAYPSPQIQDRTERSLEEHRLLGRAMRVLYDQPVLRGSQLRGSLAGTDAELRVVRTTMSMENITQLWNSFEGKVYRPSAFYLVTPVPVDSTRQLDVVRAATRDIHYDER